MGKTCRGILEFENFDLKPKIPDDCLPIQGFLRAIISMNSLNFLRSEDPKNNCSNHKRVGDSKLTILTWALILPANGPILLWLSDPWRVRVWRFPVFGVNNALRKGTSGIHIFRFTSQVYLGEQLSQERRKLPENDRLSGQERRPIGLKG